MAPELASIEAAREVAQRFATNFGSPNGDRDGWLARIDGEIRKAEAKLGVTGVGGRARLPGSNNYKVFEKGALAVGYKEVHTGNMAINSADYDDRMACQQTGFCFQGCKWGAKWSTAYTDIPRGEATGNLEVRDHAHVARILHDDSGKVTGVEYFDKDGNLLVRTGSDDAQTKAADMNANDVEAAAKIIAGTARSMGITVEG